MRQLRSSAVRDVVFLGTTVFVLDITRMLGPHREMADVQRLHALDLDQVSFVRESLQILRSTVDRQVSTLHSPVGHARRCPHT